ncbi:MAG TPA: sigma-54 dependent transcriptional regulator [Bacteroidota bacterium]
MSKGRVLIADDEVSLASSLQRILMNAGYQVFICTRGEDFKSTLSMVNPDMVLLDIFLGDVNGVDLLKNMKHDGWDIPVIMMTGNADVSLAVQAMKEGASDFVVKPFDLNHLLVLLDRDLDHARLETRVKLLQEELEEQRSRSGIIGGSMVIRRILETAEKLAKGENTTVLLEGESGTGKELIARFLHQKSSRSQREFVTVNCGAIPKDLAESEFFGYEKGAFTGATEKMKQGKFELANSGTILLDEIGELSQDMQVKLLRVLEDRRFYRLGGTREIEVDVRIIAATNKDLTKEVEAGRFREDLFYRLNVASIKIPPLRQRREDIPALTFAFLQEFARKFSKPAPKLSPEALTFLEKLHWKGNVRELRNAIERVLLLNTTPTLTTEHFSFLDSRSDSATIEILTTGRQFVLRIPTRGIEMKEVLKDLILQTLSITGGNQVQAAKILGVTRSKLRYRMEQLGIQPEQRNYRITA